MNPVLKSSEARGNVSAGMFQREIPGMKYGLDPLRGSRQETVIAHGAAGRPTGNTRKHKMGLAFIKSLSVLLL